MRIPGATYRVQLHQGFRFEDARALLPYLEKLGVTDLYASPVFQARPGSMHGYDVTDPCRVNSELGTEEEFHRLVDDLHQRGMGLMLDIVPNHMAASSENPWWMDVLENGSASQYAAYFDVEWGHQTPTVQDKILLPVLGDPYGHALEHRDISLSLEPRGFRAGYYGARFPIDPATYHDILAHRLPELLDRLDPAGRALEHYGMLLEISERLPSRSAVEWETLEVRRRDAQDVKQKLWAVYSSEPEIRAFLNRNIEIFNGHEGDPASFDLLDHLLNRQPYQLTYWRAARERINYRRFFDVSELIGIRAQDPQVFEAAHGLVFRWIAEGKVSALRIDHVDGLYDPLAYLANLQAHAAKIAGGPFHIVVEKILLGDETLPEEWPVAGTTGYDFLDVINNLFVNPAGLTALDGLYTRFTGAARSFDDIAYAQKKKIMEDLFAGEMRTLALHLDALAQQDRHGRDLSPEELRRALVEATACLPVYRTYTRDMRASAHDRAVIEHALAGARRSNPELSAACFDFLERVLLLHFEDNEPALRFVMRWQQLTGPIMAKGVEDTTLYIYNRLLSMNEVGGGPEATTLERFHTFNLHRRAHWPATMNAGSTHDAKRSEDVRARLNLLSEMPEVWERNVRRWSRWNHDKKEGAPDSSEEYLIYQTLLGAWPLEDNYDTTVFLERMKNYLRKAAREAKTHTSWLNPDEDYERRLLNFLEAILDPAKSARFLDSFRAFQSRVAFYGAINSLAQTLLRIAGPGVPDFYQGTTQWDFSLVDPDNRRATETPNCVEDAHLDDLLAGWRDGRVKTFLIHRALHFRNGNRDLFDLGEYIALNAEGLGKPAVVFARKRGDKWAVALAPRFLTALTALEKMPLGRRFWRDSFLALPPDAPTAWRNVLTGEPVSAARAGDSIGLYLSDILKSFPVALLESL
jgi:(1->4)-alpha-D-glucan 1-alpha-D-glucosylmutase